MKKIFYLTCLFSLILIFTACSVDQPVAIESSPPPSQSPISPVTPTASPEPTTTSMPEPTQPSPTLPPPTPTATPSFITFAAIGDYGQQGADEMAVAELVKSWNPDFIITLGDNNYPNGAAETIDANIGQYYADFIHPYQGEYGPGASENRFFPTLGNHDWRTSDLQPYLDYFTLPGNERYYDFVWGPVHFFALDSDTNEPDGVGVSSIQAAWLKEKMTASTAPWQIVYMHHAPYSSSRYGLIDYIQWPFAEWGADAVLAAHNHVYERLTVDEIPYIVNGIGGYPSRYFFFGALEYSHVRYRSGYGALRITADPTTLNFEMLTVENEILDSHTVTRTHTTSNLQTVTSLPDPANYQWSPIADGYSKPLLVTHANDDSDRLFVVEQTGTIQILGAESIFLDIRDRTTTEKNEQGLLGLAFDPEFAENGHFYVNYTNLQGDTVISRFGVTGNEIGFADPESEVILLTIEQPYSNHNGGHLAFGPDDFLYTGMGDGGSANELQGFAQNPETFLGKLLRLDLSTGAAEIFASGLRNPWRFSFDRLTGDLYLGDVGQNQWEEINYLPAGTEPGTNFGWDYLEGNQAFVGAPPDPTALTAPIFDYDRSDGSCSVIGGYVYRGTILVDFYGVYLFSDFCNGDVWGLVRDEAGDWSASRLFDLDIFVTSFGEDEDGNIYLVARDGGIYLLESR